MAIATRESMASLEPSSKGPLVRVWMYPRLLGFDVEWTDDGTHETRAFVADVVRMSQQQKEQPR